MTLTREDPELDRPIEGKEMLLDYFRSGEKPRERWRVGTEHEKLGLRVKTFEPIAYEQEKGLRLLLETLVRSHDWSPLLEGDTVVGVEQEGRRITLEPGGQLELSGAPLFTIHETCREFRDHIALMNHVSGEFGIVWMGLGMHPLADVEQISWVPRERHRLMRDLLAQRGTLAHHMMKGTAGVQANFDYEDPSDLARKLRVASAVSPVVMALYANSPLSGGRTNDFLTRRGWVWRHTDPDRCGVLPFVFDPSWLEGDAYERYAEWALDVPMLFIEREGRHLSVGGSTFRAFLADSGEHTPKLADWNLHLTTLFPEVRTKQVIEVRCADAVPPGLVCALPALFKGLLYDEETLSTALNRFGHWTFVQVDRLHAEVTRSGLASRTPDGPALGVAQELVDLARKGLGRIGDRNRAGEDESLFLEPLYEILDQGHSPARQLLERWDGAWQHRVDALVDYAAY